MKKITYTISKAFLFLILFLHQQSYAEIRQSLFLSDDSQMNHVEEILLETAISEATESISIGYLDYSILKKLSIGDSVYLALPDYHSEALLHVESVDHPIDGVTTFSGQVNGMEYSSFVLSQQNNQLIGSIKFDGLVYIMEPTSASDNRHVIHQLNPTLLAHDEKSDVSISADSHSHKLDINSLPNVIPDEIVQNSKTNASRNNGAVRVLFLHANNVNNPDALASNIVIEFNNVLRNSDVSNNNFIQAAGNSQMVNNNFQNRTRQQIINSMAGRSDVFNDIDLRMRSVSADVVLLITESNISDPVGGVARLFEQNNPFALTVRTYALGDLTAVHELGHVFGGSHALPLSPNEGDSPDTRGHGLEDVAGNWQTIMGGYTQGCNFDFTQGPTTQPCTRIPYFSNPALSPVDSGGQVIGNTQTADMESTLESLMPQVSNWGNTQPVNYSAAVRGFSFDTLKNGHGIHISFKDGIYYVYFYTYDAAGRPEWFTGNSTFSNNRLQGTLSRVTFNGPGNFNFTSVGSFSIDYSLPSVNNLSACDGVSRVSQPGVFNWTINGQTDSWCLQPLFSNTNGSPAQPAGNSGLWYEPAFSGWGFSTQSQRVAQLFQDTFTVVFYYDDNGQPHWAAGQSRIRANMSEFNYPTLNHFTGYPRTGSGTVTPLDIGNLDIDFSNVEADVLADYPVAPGGRWQRTNAEIFRLAD